MTSPFESPNNYMQRAAGFTAGYGLTLITGAVTTYVYRKHVRPESPPSREPSINPKIGLVSSIATTALASRLGIPSFQLGSIFLGNLCVIALGGLAQQTFQSRITCFLVISLCFVVACIASSFWLESPNSQIPEAQTFISLASAGASYLALYMYATALS